MVAQKNSAGSLEESGSFSCIDEGVRLLTEGSRVACLFVEKGSFLVVGDEDKVRRRCREQMARGFGKFAVYEYDVDAVKRQHTKSVKMQHP